VPVFSGILETLKVPLVFILGLAVGKQSGAARRALASHSLPRQALPAA